MSSKLNRFGLSRDIPSEIKRIVRQNSGFGCVVCGASVYEYEHVDPAFADSERHDPSNITLLCSQCHSRVTRRIWSKDKIKASMTNPRSLQDGFSSDYFDFDSKVQPFLDFGGIRLFQCHIPILVCGQPLFSIKPPELPNTPFLLSGIFYDSDGINSLIIVNNEWKALTSNWDVEVSGPTITIREGLRNVCLQIRAIPPYGLSVERLNMRYKDIVFKGNPDTIEIYYPSGAVHKYTGCLSAFCEVGLNVDC